MAITNFLKKVYGEGISRILYSTILVISVMESLDGYPTNSFVVLLLILLTVVSIILIESYSHLLEEDIKHKRVTDSEGVKRIIKVQLPVFIAVVFPFIFFLLSGIGAIKIELAFDLSEYSLAGMLFFYGFTARRMSGAKIPRSMLAGFSSLLIGMLIANIKVLADLLKKYI